MHRYGGTKRPKKHKAKRRGRTKRGGEEGGGTFVSISTAAEVEEKSFSSLQNEMWSKICRCFQIPKSKEMLLQKIFLDLY